MAKKKLTVSERFAKLRRAQGATRGLGWAPGEHRTEAKHTVNDLRMFLSEAKNKRNACSKRLTALSLAAAKASKINEHMRSTTTHRPTLADFVGPGPQGGHRTLARGLRKKVHEAEAAFLKDCVCAAVKRGSR